MVTDRLPPMFDKDDLNAALKALGRDDGDGSDPSDPRVEALGSLLMLAELSAMADVDRLEQESLREGGLGVAYSLASVNFGFDGEQAREVASRVVVRVLEDRVRRTQLDVASLLGGWTVAPAVDALLSAVALLLTTNQAPPRGMSAVDVEVKQAKELVSAVNSAQKAAALILEVVEGRTR